MSLYYNKKLISGVRDVPSMTLAQYNALTNKPKLWIRTDAPDSDRGINADDIEYSNGVSVKEALDDVVKIVTISGTTNEYGLINLQSQIPTNYYPIAVASNYNYVTTFFNGSNTQVQPYVKITNYDGTPRPNIQISNVNVLCIKSF